MNRSKVPRKAALGTKRAIDVIVATLGLVALSPVLGASALAVYATMGRPIFFVQERPGYKERPFKVRKLRTMRVAQAGEAYLHTDAARLTRLGRFLRRTSLDELPELWHVLTGEMSLVGPRPLLMEFLPKYTAEQHRRHDVRPGISGWAVVHGRQLIPFSKRLELDVWYVDNWSLGLDLKILAMTVRAVLRSDGVIHGQSVDDVDDLGLAAPSALASDDGAGRPGAVPPEG
ncbi:MAG: sugar transferase [Gemmatimonadaceae bacterium]|nr:sugar transferase [Gemmatimonadaceae bacterium]